MRHEILPNSSKCMDIDNSVRKMGVRGRSPRRWKENLTIFDKNSMFMKVFFQKFIKMMNVLNKMRVRGRSPRCWWKFLTKFDENFMFLKENTIGLGGGPRPPPGGAYHRWYCCGNPNKLLSCFLYNLWACAKRTPLWCDKAIFCDELYSIRNLNMQQTQNVT